MSIRRARGSGAAAEIVRRLRERASRHYRFVPNELLAILEECVRAEERLTPDDLLEETRLLKRSSCIPLRNPPP
ncbi:MAG: hypothetical protein H0V18_21250 [Pyrinomonadaceae bacterium]|nr:hypothetical protein [Pyrinomonadaceae bacterium]